MNATLTQPAPALPAPGVYKDVPFATYRAWPAVNKSSLDHIQDKSPLHCRWSMDNPEEETDALRIGRAFHTLVLEGEERFAAEFTLAGTCSAVTKSTGKRCVNAGSLMGPDGRWYCRTKGHAPDGSAEPACVLTTDQMETIQGMRRGILACDGARRFIGDDGPNELSIVWNDPGTGVPCKARLDMLRAGWNSIGDLKTTENASRDEFVKSIDRWGYHRQGAFYLRGCRALGIDVEYFSILAVEKPEPNAAAAYKLLNDAIGAGDEQIGKLLGVYAKCLETGVWWGYPDGFEDISISDWQMRKIARGN